MNQENPQEFKSFLKELNTQKLEQLFSNLLREMRLHDSKHLQGDTVTNSQTLRMLRSSGKLF